MNIRELSFTRALGIGSTELSFGPSSIVRVLSVKFHVTTDANVADRGMRVELRSGNRLVAQSRTFFQQASEDLDYTLAIAQEFLDDTAQLAQCGPLPDTVLRAVASVVITGDNGQAGDIIQDVLVVADDIAP